VAVQASAKFGNEEVSNFLLSHCAQSTGSSLSVNHLTAPLLFLSPAYYFVSADKFVGALRMLTLTAAADAVLLFVLGAPASAVADVIVADTGILYRAFLFAGTQLSL
jgi:hypothetical protein